MNKTLRILLILGFICGFASPAPTAKAAPMAASYRWEGQISGQVFKQPFRLPIVIEFSNPLRGERNPVHLAISVSDDYTVGGIILSSAQQFATSSGNVTLQYFNIQTNGSQMRAVLANTHGAEAAMLNGFVAPNVTAMTAPPVMRGVYSALGETEMFAFASGAEVRIQFNGNRLSGRIYGTGGTSLAGIFPLPPVIYSAEFTASLVK